MIRRMLSWTVVLSLWCTSCHFEVPNIQPVDAAADGGADGATDGEIHDSGLPTACNENCVYVRSGASGNGSDWTDALPDLPATLQRGHTYLVAAGDYAGYTFDDQADGTKLITIVRASADNHGTDTGWEDAYGTGQAVFGPLLFTAPHYLVDGGPDGNLVVRGAFTGSVVKLEDGGDHVTLRRIELDGHFGKDASYHHSQGACSGILAKGSDNLTVERCEIHNLAVDGVRLTDLSNVTLENNTIRGLFNCCSANACGSCTNGHSNCIELTKVKHGTFERNLLHHTANTTSGVFFSHVDEPNNFCEDILLANNIIYTPNTGLVAYIGRAFTVRLYHNVFWGQRNGAYGGIALGPALEDLRMYNNIILSINLNHMAATHDASQHHADYNLIGVDIGQFPLGPNDLVAKDPLFSEVPDIDGPAVPQPTISDFALEAQSLAVNKAWAGDQNDSMPSTDMLGNPRVDAPDIGPLERQ